MSKHVQRIGFATICIAVMTIGVRFWLAPAAPGIAMPADTIAVTTVPATAMPAPVASSGNTQTSQDQLEALSQIPTSLALLDAGTLHFMPPTMSTPEQFAGGATRVVMDPSCAARTTFKPDATRSIEASLISEFGINADARVPLGVPFEELTQFYRVGTNYFQLSVNEVPASRPPVYRISLYRASDAQMRGDVANLALPNSVSIPNAAAMDATRAGEIFMQMLDQARSQNAELGARMLNVSIPGANSSGDQELRFVNGAPLQWAFGSGVCQLSADMDSTLCRCVPDGEKVRVPNV